MRRAIEKAILAVVDDKTAKTTHSMCVAARVSVSLRAVCSWIATCNCRTSRSSKSTRINSPTSSPTTPVCRSKPGVTDCDAEGPSLIAFHGGAEVRVAARSPIAFDAVRRKDVRRSREVVAGETRWSRRGARSLPSRLGLGIGVGKGWEAY